MEKELGIYIGGELFLTQAHTKELGLDKGWK